MLTVHHFPSHIHVFFSEQHLRSIKESTKLQKIPQKENRKDKPQEQLVEMGCCFQSGTPFVNLKQNSMQKI